MCREQMMILSTGLMENDFGSFRRKSTIHYGWKVGDIVTSKHIPSTLSTCAGSLTQWRSSQLNRRRNNSLLPRASRRRNITSAWYLERDSLFIMIEVQGTESKDSFIASAPLVFTGRCCTWYMKSKVFDNQAARHELHVNYRFPSTIQIIHWL